MATPDFASMNETDVRELVVRPLIQKLGYSPGEPNNVRTEVLLRYNQRVLGHRRPKTDHVMQGRADYVCDVVSYGRWTVEVKAPNVEISELDWEQAHSYAAHPEIAASHFLITNGKSFRLYSLLEPRTPVLEWTHETQSAMWVNIANILAPEQIRVRRSRERQDNGRALAPGLGSSVRIVGGLLEYGDYTEADSFSFPATPSFDSLKGLRATVQGDRAFRNADGLISVQLRLAGPTAEWDALNKAAGVEVYEFSSADEYISVSEEHPTIFQGLVRFELPAGTPLSGLPGLPPGEHRLPFAMNASAFMQATGFLRDKTVRGVFSIAYRVKFPSQLTAFGIPEVAEFKNVGDFHANVE